MRVWHDAFRDNNLVELARLIKNCPEQLEEKFEWNFWSLVTPLGCALMTRNMVATSMILAAGVDPNKAHCFSHVLGERFLYALEMVLHFGFGETFAAKLIEYGADWTYVPEKFMTKIRTEMFTQRRAFILNDPLPTPPAERGVLAGDQEKKRRRRRCYKTDAIN